MREKLKEEFKEVLNQWFDIKITELDENLRMIEDLGLDSLDMLDLWLTLEDTTKTDISEEELKGCKTIGDVLDVFEKHEKEVKG